MDDHLLTYYIHMVRDPMIRSFFLPFNRTLLWFCQHHLTGRSVSEQVQLRGVSRGIASWQ